MIIEDRPYQKKCVEQCMEHYRSGIDSVMLESPVGSGKTIMGLMIIRELNALCGGGLSCAWVAPRHHLLDQLTEANCDFNLNITPVSMFSRRASHYDIVILDEAHHEATGSFIRLFQEMSPRYLLGLSATPLRTDKMKLAFKETVNLCSIRSLIMDGYLSKFHLYNIEKMNPETAAFHYLLSPEKWGQTIVFMPTLADCEQFSALLAAQGVTCPVVYGGRSNQQILAGFCSGKTRVIVNCHMLTEGFDLPELNTVFLKDATRLPVIQMAGRALRRAPGKAFANFVQSKKARFPVQRIADPAASFLWRDDKFQSVSGRNEKVRETVFKYLQLREARGDITLPEILTRSAKVEKVWI